MPNLRVLALRWGRPGSPQRWSSAAAELRPEPSGYPGPFPSPPVTAYNVPQAQHRIHAGPRPVHPPAFQPRFNHQLVGALHGPAADGPALSLKDWVLHLGCPLFQLSQTAAQLVTLPYLDPNPQVRQYPTGPLRFAAAKLLPLPCINQRRRFPKCAPTQVRHLLRGMGKVQNARAAQTMQVSEPRNPFGPVGHQGPQLPRRPPPASRSPPGPAGQSSPRRSTGENTTFPSGFPAPLPLPQSPASAPRPIPRPPGEPSPGPLPAPAGPSPNRATPSPLPTPSPPPGSPRRSPHPSFTQGIQPGPVRQESLRIPEGQPSPKPHQNLSQPRSQAARQQFQLFRVDVPVGHQAKNFVPAASGHLHGGNCEVQLAGHSRQGRVAQRLPDGDETVLWAVLTVADQLGTKGTSAHCWPVDVRRPSACRCRSCHPASPTPATAALNSGVTSTPTTNSITPKHWSLPSAQYFNKSC